MDNISRFIISYEATIKDSLIVLNGVSHDCQTLFVVDSSQKVIGTLTDGDVRRGLISGKLLSDKVIEVMHRDFRYLRDNYEYDVKQLKKYRDNNIYFVPILDSDDKLVKICDLKQHKTYLPIDAVLMAGGKGERLRPLTEKTPKPLLKVGDKAIIDHNVDRLISYGVEHISVTVNYLREQIEEHYKYVHNGVFVKCYREPKFLGTMGSIKYVEQFYNDTILVMNSDLFTNIDYEDFYLHFRDHDADMSVAAIPYSVSIPYGILDLEQRRNIVGLLEKPTYDYYANAGIYLIKKAVFDLIPSNEFFNATDLIQLLIEQSFKVIRYPLNGTWIDIGNPQEYKRANDLVKHLN